MPNGAAATVPRPRHFYTEPEWLGVGDVRVACRRQGGGEPVPYLHGCASLRRAAPPASSSACRPVRGSARRADLEELAET
jgi:hypothetical protein